MCTKNDKTEETQTRLFEFYKRELIDLSKKHGQIRFNVIEYVCYFPGIDPIYMGATLMNDGYVIAFDDTSISVNENAKKQKNVIYEAQKQKYLPEKCEKRWKD